MAMVDVGLQPTGGLTAQVSWLYLRVGGRLALSYIRQMKRMNFCSDFVTMTCTINIVRVWYYIIIIIIIIIIL